jgi:CHRD domain
VKQKKMMTGNLRRDVLAISILAILSLIMVMAPSTKFVFATTTTTQSSNKFVTKLTGKDEVPPKDTKATGTADFELSSNGNMLKYKVNVMNIDKVTQAHIHSGKVGQNGEVVVTLFKSQTPTGPKSGILSQGDITSANLEGPLKGKQVSDLIKLINNGEAYVNVHTEMNPKGEIRGQISK